ncbi:HAMP domain-containing sensor histidine kinase [Pontibacter korlensis]|uniref:histidine kinase n=1 Tax=Pontibacter korlensis TaxID=400092 RepID=A0A0E3UXU7_9BACT|nr:HAMP domain-containing sensor histidine kinase [Pontibacter korlensis]AKD04552.1 histidine kinase [Pontibacter korlensis]
MRVLTKTSLYYLLVSLVVFAVGGTSFYLMLREEIYDEVDDQLFTDKENIISYIRQHNRLPNVTSGISEAILVRDADPDNLIMEQLSDTLIYSSYDEEDIPFRQLTFTVYRQGKPYEYTIFKSLMDFQDLTESTVLAMFWIFLLLLVGLVYVNYYINKYTWRHFYDTLAKIKSYTLSRQKPLELQPSSTKEFEELNQVLQSMTGKIHSDYLNLKEFTENVSHEIQTPLAIVSSKVELFMQSENLTEEQAKLLSDMYGAVNRLARLNKSLILLTRIENREFKSKEQVPLHRLLQEQLTHLQDIISMRGLTVELEALEEVYLYMNSGLADILLQNLLNNAIKHNHQGGSIKVILTSHKLCIKNTGEAPQDQPERLFNRFHTGHDTVESLGIGLALVKKICNLYGHIPKYSFSAGEHSLCVYFT